MSARWIVLAVLLAGCDVESPEGRIAKRYWHEHYDVRCNGTQMYQTSDRAMADSLAQRMAQVRAGECDVYQDWNILHWDSVGVVRK